MNKRFLLILILTALAASTAYQYYDSRATPLPDPVDSRPSDQSLLVSSWNIQDGRTLYGADNIINVKKEFENGLGNSDIVALQEATLEELLAGLSQDYGYHVYGTANIILSKLPIRDSGTTIINPDTGRRATWADIEIKNGTLIRVYSVHLSYKVKRWPFIPEIRGKEMEQLLNHASTFDGPVILAGDFNTLSLLKTNVDEKPVLQNSYQAGYNNAYHNLSCNTHLVLGRIDWLFHKGLTLKSSRCGEFSGSDHRWMQARFSGE